LPYIDLSPGTDNVLQYQMIEQPCYCDGVEISLQSSRDVFFKAYPNIDYNIRKALTKNYFFSDLTIQTAQFMCSVFIIKFDLVEIDNLFIKDGKE